MAKYEIAAHGVGAYEKKLTANTVDEVVFADDLDAVEVITDGSAPIDYTVDGSAPTVNGEHCFHLPAVPSVRETPSYRTSGTVVKLISSGTPTYSVARVSV